MADPFSTLGVAVDATDAAIRARYLELAREFTPEQHPAKFAAVRSAFEKIKTADARARYRLFDAGADESVDALIEELTCQASRPRIGLEKLVSSLHPPR